MANKNVCTALPPPYPRLGEVYRALALAFDTKNKDRNVDRLAREGDIDWSLHEPILQTLLLKPLSSDGLTVDEVLCDELPAFFKDYIGLVSTVTLDGLSRAQALPILAEHFFVPWGARVLLELHRRHPGPDLAQLLAADSTAVAAVLAWLDSQESANGAVHKIAYPDTTDHHRDAREMVAKWRRGDAQPNFGSIKNLCNDSDKAVLKAVPVAMTWLVVARALDHFDSECRALISENEGQFGRSPRRAMWSHILQGQPPHDIGKTLWAANRALVPDPDRAIVERALHAFQLLQRESPKGPEEREASRVALQAAEAESRDYDPEGRTRYKFHWMWGRWHVLSGDAAEALKAYKQAVHFALYRAGDEQKEIIGEALALAANQGDKVFMKQLKHPAIALGLFAEPESDTPVVADWEIEQFAREYGRIFPESGRFPQASASQAKARVTDDPMGFSFQEGAKKAPDLKNPNKLITQHFSNGATRKLPQLQYFLLHNQFEKFKAVLDHGADVDQLDDAGGSAILKAIQHTTTCREGVGVGSNDVRYLQALMAHPHKPETLNRLTVRQRLTPLMCAIDHGDAAVIGRLVDMGAEVDLKASVDDCSPLYAALSKIGSQRVLLNQLRTVHFGPVMTGSDAAQREAMRRMAHPMADLYGDLVYELPSFGRNDLIQRAVLEIVTKAFDIQKVYQMVETLLRLGADPNLAHPSRHGRTPLMLAAELDNPLLFEMLLDHGGDVR